MKELKLIPPSDPRVQTAIAPFDNSMLKDEGFKDRKELTKKMYELMAKYGGIGLSANQIGLPFNSGSIIAAFILIALFFFGLYSSQLMKGGINWPRVFFLVAYSHQQS